MKELEIRHWGIAPTVEDFDIETGPADRQNFVLEFRVDVGVQGEEAITDYQIFVCTPLGLSAEFNRLAGTAADYAGRSDVYLFGRGVLVVPSYDLDLILRAIERDLKNLQHYAFDLS